MTLTNRFIPGDLEINDWTDVKPYFQHLEAAEPKDAAALAALIQQYSDVLSVFHENNAWAYINMTRETDNEEAVKRHELFATIIAPAVDQAANRVEKKIFQHPAFQSLDKQRYEMLQRRLQREIEIYRAENVDLQAEVAKYSTQYDQLMGGLTVSLDGEEMPLPKAGTRLLSSDRSLRREAWLAIQETRYAVKTDADRIFNEMLQRRNRIGLNAGYENYRDYQHDALHRFDYTPADALAFQDSIAEFVVPLAKDIQLRQRERLGLEADDFRPWDTEGAPPQQQPLEPFEKGDELLEKTIRIFKRLRPAFGDNLIAMRENGLFDLDSRKGKAPGGYNYGLEVTGMPFIFMNAAGTHRNVVTMCHEGGHAMHTFLTHGEPLIQYRDTPAEMAETASMSMELLTSSGWEEFYGPEDLRRARREHLEGIIKFFPWCATVDAFQHWIYLHPQHDFQKRDSAFLEISERFESGLINWEGYEHFQRNGWQRQLHIFGVPFYYVEYGIAQLGALQVYRNFRKDPENALEAYCHGLSLGASRPMPEIWESMGIHFDFSATTIQELMTFVQAELNALNTEEVAG